MFIHARGIIFKKHALGRLLAFGINTLIKKLKIVPWDLPSFSTGSYLQISAKHYYEHFYLQFATFDIVPDNRARA